MKTALIAAALILAASSARADTVRASFYGAEMHGRANGKKWNPLGRTLAHRTLPMGSQVEVCFHRCEIGTVTDRGPAAWTGRQVDLSRGLARAIDMERAGVGNIVFRVITLGPRQ